ncbi:thioredoxin [bacterium]|nr:thioredoxin [candidate division CSSED10-310 bacterium]
MESLNEKQFQEKVVNSVGLVLVDYGATWCGPCKKLKPLLEELAGTKADQAEFYYVDAGEQPTLAQKYGVMSLPTLLFFKNGEVKDRIVGLVAREKIVDKIDALA